MRNPIFSNSDAGCAIGNTTLAAWTSAITVQPADAAVLQSSQISFSVQPSVPVSFSLGDTSGFLVAPNINAGGDFHSGTAVSDQSVRITATATDGSGRTGTTHVRSLLPIRVVPEHSSLHQGQQLQFSERDNLPVRWAIDGVG
jgi:hypothetical protein